MGVVGQDARRLTRSRQPVVGGVYMGLSAFLDDGTTLGGLGEGTWQQVEGQHKWRISLVIEVSNGDRFRSEDDIDLTTRSLTGKFSEEA